jgi:hypothetical protein
MAPIKPRDDQPLSEADIHAYADGNLASDRAEHLRRYLNRRPDEARRVAFYGRLNAQMKHAFTPADEPFQARAFGAPGRRAALNRRFTPGARNVATRALLTLALVFVTLSGWIVASQASDEALSNAAVMALAQASDDRQEAGPPPHPAGSGDAGPDLAPAGLRLAAKSTLSLGPNSRIPEFVYLNADGRPVVLLASRALAAPDKPQWVARRVGNIRLLTWTVRHRRYVLAGEADTRGLMRAADILTLH